MRHWLLPLRLLPAGLALGVMMAGGACQSIRPARATDAVVAETGARLVGLHPGPVRPAVLAEARRLAAVAEQSTRNFAAEYRVGGPSWWHNCLVNIGLKQRGLCWHYMEDLFAKLAAEHPVNFDLHCGVRDDENLFLEHNCVVITAAGKEFASGLVLDPWRKPGQLVIHPTHGAGRTWHEQRGYTQALQRRAMGRE